MIKIERFEENQSHLSVWYMINLILNLGLLKKSIYLFSICIVVSIRVNEKV